MTASPSYYTKDPDAVLDYAVDWSQWLDDEETIATSTWVVPDGITRDSDTNDDKTATIWLSGGTLGRRYTITNRVTTTADRTDDRSIVITVHDR